MFIQIMIKTLLIHLIGPNAFGPNPNWVSANHCQVVSKLLVYKLKICRDPERCLKSLAYR